MNRRMALMLGLFSGGLLPAQLYAQTRPKRSSAAVDDDAPAGTFRRPKSSTRTARRDAAETDEESNPAPEDVEPLDEPAAGSAPPADFREEAGEVWRTFDISKYTSLPHASSTPQTALVEWIFRRTGSALWHGDKVAVLSAGRSQLRAYHTPKVLKQVQDIVERFTDQQVPDILRLRVRFIAAADTRWRYLVATRLNPIGSGPQGQQIWTVRSEDAAMVRTQMAAYDSFRALLDQEYKLVNGQTLSVKQTKPVDYIVGPQRDSGAGLGFEEGSAQLEEGVVLRISPLLNYEGDAVDAAIDLRGNTVKAFHRTRVMVRRDVGPADMTIDVPEVVESRLNQTVQGWPIGQTLLISGGIQPGILQSKGGLFNLRLPGTVPTSTELLVFLDLETVSSPSRTARRGRSSDAEVE
jgi:hypothetical protein